MSWPTFCCLLSAVPSDFIAGVLGGEACAQRAACRPRPRVWCGARAGGFGRLARHVSASEFRPLTALCVRRCGGSAVQFRQPWGPEWGRLVIPCRDCRLRGFPCS
ncbi:hypothetical protein TcCL_NonESM06893 [Trypanosoma cruzi]|nr:hypothetical protein TcCL_NonESM06893 [Trypanosoma cruzi]